MSATIEIEKKPEESKAAQEKPIKFEESIEVDEETKGVQAFLEPEKKSEYQIKVYVRFRPMFVEELSEKDRC